MFKKTEISIFQMVMFFILAVLFSVRFFYAYFTNTCVEGIGVNSDTCGDMLLIMAIMGCLLSLFICYMFYSSRKKRK